MRYLHGCTAADVTTLENGRVTPLRTGLTCWYSWQGTDSCTDLTDLAGNPVGTLTSDAFGAVAFYGPDGYSGPLWLDLGRGARVLVRPVDPGDSRPAPTPITWKSANVSAWNIGEYADDEAILSQVNALGLNVVSIPVQVAADDIYDSTPTINEASMARALEVAALLPDDVQIIAEPYPWVDDGNQSENLVGTVERRHMVHQLGGCLRRGRRGVPPGSHGLPRRQPRLPGSRPRHCLGRTGGIRAGSHRRCSQLPLQLVVRQRPPRRPARLGVPGRDWTS